MLANDESVLSREVRDWDITNLISNSNANHSRIRTEPVEEEKVPASYAGMRDNYDIDVSSDLLNYPDPMQRLRELEGELFPASSSHAAHKTKKQYSQIREASSHVPTAINYDHNFVRNGVKVNTNDRNIEQYMNEIRGLPTNTKGRHSDVNKHANRIRGLDEQDNLNHPLLSDALAFNGNCAATLVSNVHG